MQNKIEEVHINRIDAGDTVIHYGVEKTVCKSYIGGVMRVFWKI